MKEAIVLASGLGKRLRTVTGDMPKVFYKFSGCELVKYPIISFMKRGVERFVLVVAKGHREYGEKILRDLNVRGVVVENERVELGNAYSFFLSESYVESGRFFLSCGDSLFLPEALDGAFSDDDFHIKLGVSKVDSLVDTKEASKVLTDEDGNIIKIGKKIQEYNYLDTGVFVMTEEAFRLKEHFSWTEEISLYHVLQKAVDLGMIVRVFDFGNLPWTELDSPEDLNEEVYKLMEKIREGIPC
ncbi:sugar phosphate nucleotidyltransferase [Thermotoga sp.]|uniref:sugar phosphate nucleotidyltransferase n=1 Tax=Thermotoga sp. TaxID=28240 RepID=UPI0025F635DA|nr:sugar phosphate nucleotidyltransferase [Thermotoga sp.]MCD6551140.1 nucleotidyl transferase [Thermotoga sp.]